MSLSLSLCSLTPPSIPQDRDARAYQIYLGLSDGSAFLGCTPERLYVRSGPWLASEAVAGTRPRGRAGCVEEDFMLGLALLRSPKDHAEFSMVRDWIAAQLAGEALSFDMYVSRDKGVVEAARAVCLWTTIRAGALI